MAALLHGSRSGSVRGVSVDEWVSVSRGIISARSLGLVYSSRVSLCLRECFLLCSRREKNTNEWSIIKSNWACGDFISLYMNRMFICLGSCQVNFRLWDLSHTFSVQRSLVVRYLTSQNAPWRFSSGYIYKKRDRISAGTHCYGTIIKVRTFWEPSGNHISYQKKVLDLENVTCVWKMQCLLNLWGKFWRCSRANQWCIKFQPSCCLRFNPPGW